MTQPLPQTGGSYTRDEDGKLTQSQPAKTKPAAKRGAAKKEA